MPNQKLAGLGNPNHPFASVLTDPDAIRTILAHLRQRAPPDAVRLQGPGQGPQNDLFAAI